MRCPPCLVTLSHVPDLDATPEPGSAPGTPDGATAAPKGAPEPAAAPQRPGSAADRLAGRTPAAPGTPAPPATPGPEAPAAGAPTVESLQAELAAARAALTEANAAKEEWRNMATRSSADLSNIRRRSVADKEELTKFAIAKPALALIETLDNLERAIEHTSDDQRPGLEMIASQFRKALTDAGIERIDAMNQPFSEKLHAAVARDTSPDVEGPTVTRVVQNGYVLHERVIRPASVIVTFPA